MRYFLSRLLRLSSGQPYETIIERAAAFAGFRQLGFIAILRSCA
jgi:hypothetical protein